ncbi:MAG: DNA-binding response regulator [Paenibacillus sp.]|jgi:DNA-binding response OmpR family regulator|nr:DNA-binding response regulator [Paenibacillus sp.]
MQRESELSLSSHDSLLSQSASAEPAPGDYCSTTHRIVVISPFPYSLHELVRELTVKCYDVLVFRHLDDEALAVLPIDLMIMDLTKESVLAPGAAQRSWAQAVPTLRLISSESPANEKPGSAAQTDVSMYWESSTIGQVLERIHTMLPQGSRQSGQKADQIQLKDLIVDYKRVSVYAGASRIDVTKTEFDLLKALLDAGGQVLSRQELMDRVWGDHYFGGSNTVDVHVKSLRHKLKDDPKSPKYIATIRGVGYRIAD